MMMDSKTHTAGRDDGSVMVLVLVLMVIGALVVLPTINYTMSVLRANEALSEKTAKAEAVKAGFRMAMAEPADLYETCGYAGLNTSRPLPSPGLDIATTSECFLLENTRAVDDSDLPYGLATTHVSYSTPTGAGMIGTTYPGSSDPSDPTSWLDDAESASTDDMVWLPNLPVHGLNLRTGPRELPPEYVMNGYTTCDVYFPGTYKQPIELDGPVYFTSGIYYFEDEVRVIGGAEVLAGQGTDPGCANDQQAAFYAVNAPATHNINGLGVTFVFGDNGRLVIDDSAGPVDFKMSQRYVAPDDDGVASSARVSIMTVNGDLDEALEATDFDNAGTSLFVEDQIAVPLSLVGTEVTRPAPVDDYRPSLLTPEPREPEPPLNVVASQRNAGALVVSWDPPATDGGSPITGYTVTGAPAGSCTTTGGTICVMDGLTNGVDHVFTAVAINDIGQSIDSDPSPAIKPNGSAASLSAPDEPDDIRIVESLPSLSVYSDAFEVSWDEPSDDGGAPIDRYEVEVEDSIGTIWTCETDGELTCVVNDAALDVAEIYQISVRARNMANFWSAWELDSGYLLDGLGAPYVAPPVVPPPTSIYTPLAVVEIASTATAADNTVVSIPGYIAVPQGVVRVDVATPAAADVALTGGGIAAWFDLVDPRPSDFELGLLNPTTQRRIRVVTRLVGDTTMVSDAVVQVNETGGWAVNSWQVQTG